MVPRRDREGPACSAESYGERNVVKLPKPQEPVKGTYRAAPSVRESANSSCSNPDIGYKVGAAFIEDADGIGIEFGRDFLASSVRVAGQSFSQFRH